MGPGPDALGMIDGVDQYCPPGSFNQAFSFGSYFTSIAMEIHEESPVLFSSTDASGGSDADQDELKKKKKDVVCGIACHKTNAEDEKTDLTDKDSPG
jgi:hypothetical protein